MTAKVSFQGGSRSNPFSRFLIHGVLGNSTNNGPGLPICRSGCHKTPLGVPTFLRLNRPGSGLIPK
jgi:hypothetical protein